MSQKRGGSFSYHGDRGQSSNNKRPRPNDAYRPAPSFDRHNHGHSNPHHGSSRNPNANQTFKNKDNPVLDHIERLPEPEHCTPCQLATAEMQTGTMALLDKLVADEMSTEGDKEILYHARELHRLLSSRASRPPSKSAQELNEKRPDKGRLIYIPAYIDHKIKQAKDLPQLPSITEPFLQQAVFTHSSYNADTRGKGVNTNQINYERLEFLGDAYIELIASRLLYNRFPHVDVPQQSHFRENLVKNETLGKFSEAYGLPDRLKHGGHIKDSKAWTKVIADVFEAYVAAIVLSDPEQGFSTAEQWLTELWTPQLLAYKEKMVDNARARDDLQSKLLLKGVKLDYREEKPMAYENGVQKYFMGVYLTGWNYEDEWLGSGEGQNKAQGCIAAAADAMKRESNVFKDAMKKKQEAVAQRKREREAQEAEQGPTQGEAGKNDLSATGQKGERAVEDQFPKKKKRKT